MATRKKIRRNTSKARRRPRGSSELYAVRKRLEQRIEETTARLGALRHMLTWVNGEIGDEGGV